MRTTLLLVLGLAAIVSATYSITYSAYKDQTCSSPDNTMTGEIFAYQCSPEYRTSNDHFSGRITQINKDWLISCDYSDHDCSQLKVCENYTNSACYASTSSRFSNSYVWTEDATQEGGWKIMYNSYTDQKCLALNSLQTGQIFFDKCSQEYETVSQSGMITFINDYYLTSCDYSDDTCGQVTVCENYTNSICYGSQVVSFSNKYSWHIASSAGSDSKANSDSASNADSSSNAVSIPDQDGGDDYLIYYSGYTDNTCSSVDDTVSGRIFAHTCAIENRKAPGSGKIAGVNATHLISCDYSDTQCSTQIGCDVIDKDFCYSSSSSKFSNRYSWYDNGDGTFTITYSSFSDNACKNADVSGQLFYDVCAPEMRTIPQSGRIEFINDEYLTSCDYSDTLCKDLLICVNYTNAACADSATASFSNKYTWTRSEQSSASSAAASILFGLVGVVFVLTF